MKKLLLIGALALAGVAWGDYNKDMAQLHGSKMAVTWQDENKAALAEATTADALEAFVRDAASAKALLSEVKGAYATCPMKATQIAAVSQLVMKDDCRCPLAFLAFWRQTRDDQRRIWTAALLEAARESSDSYVKVFMLDQLRWCGYAEQAPCVSVFRASSDKAVADMAELVATELARTKK